MTLRHPFQDLCTRDTSSEVLVVVKATNLADHPIVHSPDASREEDLSQDWT